LATRLTIAFLLAGLTGAVLVAVIVHQTTRTAFDRYRVDQGREALAEWLQSYYQANGSWNGIDRLVRSRDGYDFGAPHDNQPPPSPAPGAYPGAALYPPPLRLRFTLIDSDRRIVLGGQRSQVGQLYTDTPLDQASALTSNGQPVGWLVLDASVDNPLAEPEALFLQRLNRATLVSALIAGGLALLLGGLMALTLTRSLRELTEATEGIARGELGRQVKIRSKDELGALALSFNKMSSDLERATRARRQMTADIAHDLRTPLSVISGYAEALHDGKLPGSQEVYEILDHESRYLSRLVEDLRLLSLADAGELQLVRQAVAPQVIVERAAARHARTAGEKSIRLPVEIDPGLPEINVDVERMAQVLDNLMVNAFRYTPAGGSVTLRAAAGRGGVQISVRDTGVGIAAQDLSHIFDRFYRGDAARTQAGESGLGLAIARSIVEAHGGKIEVSSTPGAGAEFQIWLPAR
ncbi:MAG: sensor histidine kinase, partial [Chloroflexota bacterium]